VGKREVLQTLTIGRRVAEEEVDQLASYFVETDQWRRMAAGQVDIVFGPKGAGKSAIYSTLLGRESELFDQKVLLVSAEQPRGTPAFKDLVGDPPTSEVEFVGLWKFYILSLLGGVLVDYELRSDQARRVLTALEEAGLVPVARAPLRGLIKSALDYVRMLLRRPPESFETGVSFDPATGSPTGFTAKITLGEPSAVDKRSGYISVDELLKLADEALELAGYRVWILFDRLDVAFAESRELESNALRALFKAYLDLLASSQVSLKVFLRTDIWKSITAGGFREASHITRTLTISWNEASLLNLVVRRLLQNDALREMYGVDGEQVLSDSSEQREFFERLVPEQVDSGRNPKTFQWLLGRAQDGTKTVAPRELIHLLTQARDLQLLMLERGEREPQDEMLLSRQALREALPEVSRVRLERTIYAEYPEVKDRLEALRRGKTNQTVESLAEIWVVSIDEAQSIASHLVEIGFFELRSEKGNPSYWVPFLYRPALEMSQGTAE
jgi:hypothetical protein